VFHYEWKLQLQIIDASEVEGFADFVAAAADSAASVVVYLVHLHYQ
jgi:hypothetical protein